MATKKTIEKATQDKLEGKSASIQAGEFIHEEIKQVRRKDHGVRSPEQAIAIGLSESRRAGVNIKAPKGKVSEKTRKSAKATGEKAKRHVPISKKRSLASKKALKKEPTNTVSHAALSKQARSVAKKASTAKKSNKKTTKSKPKSRAKKK